MPHCYFVNDYRQSERVVIDSPAPDRAEHGLPPLLLPPPPPPPVLRDDEGVDDPLVVARRLDNERDKSVGKGARDWTKTPRAHEGRSGGGRCGATMPAVPRQQWHRGGNAVKEGVDVLEGVGRGSGGGGGGGVVLCNFNRLHKIDPYTFGAWMEVRACFFLRCTAVYRLIFLPGCGRSRVVFLSCMIYVHSRETLLPATLPGPGPRAQVLRTVPGTVLWLLDGGETARSNLRQQARLAGVEEGRVVFAPLVGKEEHLQRLRLADLFVDTPVSDR